jgi:hypothetical protein
VPVLIYVVFIFIFHDSIEYTIQLRSMYQELSVTLLCLVQNFRKLTDIQSSEVCRISFQEKEYKYSTQFYYRYSGVLVRLSTGLVLL